MKLQHEEILVAPKRLSLCSKYSWLEQENFILYYLKLYYFFEIISCKYVYFLPEKESRC